MITVLLADGFEEIEALTPVDMASSGGQKGGYGGYNRQNGNGRARDTRDRRLRTEKPAARPKSNV